MFTCPECSHRFEPGESAADEAEDAAGWVVCPECAAAGLPEDFGDDS